MASASAKKRAPSRRKKSAKVEAEEELLEKGRCAGLKAQHRLEAANHSQVENEMARVRMQRFLEGGADAIPWDAHGGFPF